MPVSPAEAKQVQDDFLLSDDEETKHENASSDDQRGQKNNHFSNEPLSEEDYDYLTEQYLIDIAENPELYDLPIARDVCLTKQSEKLSPLEHGKRFLSDHPDFLKQYSKTAMEDTKPSAIDDTKPSAMDVIGKSYYQVSVKIYPLGDNFSPYYQMFFSDLSQSDTEEGCTLFPIKNGTFRRHDGVLCDIITGEEISEDAMSTELFTPPPVMKKAVKRPAEDSSTSRMGEFFTCFVFFFFFFIYLFFL